MHPSCNEQHLCGRIDAQNFVADWFFERCVVNLCRHSAFLNNLHTLCGDEHVQVSILLTLDFHDQLEIRSLSCLGEPLFESRHLMTSRKDHGAGFIKGHIMDIAGLVTRHGRTVEHQYLLIGS